MAANVLSSNEIEFYISKMEPFQMEDIGGTSWIDWHQRIQKLNQQAVLEASELREESVKDFLVLYDKINVLVHEAILISVWRSRILPRLLKIQPNPENTFFLYSVLYHEATAVALLELALYHSDSCEVLQYCILDLLDYAYDSASGLIGLKPKIQDPEDSDHVPDLALQQVKLSYDIGMRSISILFHIISNDEKLPISAVTRIMNTLDVPLLLIQLIEEKPWQRIFNNELQQYVDGNWLAISNDQDIKLTNHEAHLWLSLRQLFLDPKTCPIYEFNQFRKSQLIKLQKYLNEIILDQIPHLMDFKYWLAQIPFSDPPIMNKSIILEVVPEIKTNILNKSSKKMKKIVNVHADRFFTTDKLKLMEIANSLSEGYNLDFIEKMEQMKDGEHTCAGCNKQGAKRCSKCRNTWYCSRECQVNHWPRHKENCLTP